MPHWGLTRVAYGCRSLAEILAREPLLLRPTAEGPVVVLHTARAPRRDLSGGSLFWIVQHHLVARQPIVAIHDGQPGPEGHKAEIHLAPGPIPVHPQHQAGHQGWRYLAQAQWPADLASNEADLPADLRRQLAGLFLA